VVHYCTAIYTGRPPEIKSIHLKWIRETLKHKTPKQLNLPFSLWTRDQLVKAFEMKFGIKMSLSNVSRILNKQGFSFQKPAERFHQQDPVIVKKWIEEDFPKIKTEAKKKKAEVYFGDEAGVCSKHSLNKTIGIKGETSIVTRTAKRFKMNMISAISQKGACRFMVTESNVSSAIFLEFLKRLVDGAPHPIFLILDNHPIHKTKQVKEFVESTQGMLKIFYLPPYSPELNPDELVWNDVKNHGLSRTLLPDEKALKSAVLARLHSLQKLPEKVMSFFHTSTTTYAAA
jgi:transposase